MEQYFNGVVVLTVMKGSKLNDESLITFPTNCVVINHKAIKSYYCKLHT
jgi:hypothetical protein